MVLTCDMFQIWDVFSQESKQVANFSGHEQRLYCCLWSPTDPDVVFSGGEDCCLHAFRVSRQRNKRPQGKVNPAKEFKKRAIKENREVMLLEVSSAGSIPTPKSCDFNFLSKFQTNEMILSW